MVYAFTRALPKVATITHISKTTNKESGANTMITKSKLSKMSRSLKMQIVEILSKPHTISSISPKKSSMPSWPTMRISMSQTRSVLNQDIHMVKKLNLKS